MSSSRTAAGSGCPNCRGASPRIRSTPGPHESWWTTPTRVRTRGNDLASGAPREASFRLQAHSRPEAADARRGARLPARPKDAHADAGLGDPESLRGNARGGVRRDEEGFRVVAENEMELVRPAGGAARRLSCE